MLSIKNSIISIIFNLVFFLFRFYIAGFLFLYSTVLSAAPEQVSIQLKWKHSFQFAGYYAAIEKGFYSDAGLEVTLKELDLSKENVEQVISGKSEYGVSDSSLLIYHLNGKPVVLINQIFQHSPMVFMSRRGSGIISPYEMVGKTVVSNISNEVDAPLNAMLLSTLGDLSKTHQVSYQQSYFQGFVESKVDVISAYSTSQPYLLKQQGIEVNIINPQSYGIDYYGDNLFTSEKELNEHPARVEKISQATIKGWQYALDHPDEIIQLIRNKYDPKLSEDHLQYEARTTRQIIIPELIELGSVDPKRYQRAAEDYQRLGFAQSSQIKNNFFYKQTVQDTVLVKLTAKEQAWIKAHHQVIVGGDPDWTPFNFKDENGQYSGIANDYLNLIAKKTGIKFKVIIDQWSHNLEKIRDKKIDLLGTVYHTDARSQYLTYSKPYFEMLDYFFIRDDLDVKTFDDLNGRRVAIPKDYAHQELIKQHFPKIKIVTVNTFGEAIDAVLENRADMLYDTYGSLTYTIKKEGINTIIPFKSTRHLGKKTIHIASRKDAPELASIIQKGLDAISIQERRVIYNKWLGKIPEAEKLTLKLTKEEQAWISEHPVIRVSAEKDWPPFDFVGNDGQLQGITIDYWRLISERLGIRLELVTEGSWTERQKKLKRQELDAVGAIAQTVARDKFLNFTQPYLNSPTVVVSRINDNALTLDEMAAEPVAVEQGYITETMLREQYPDLELMLMDNTLQALEAVSAGKARAYVGQRAVISYLSQQHMMTNLKIGNKSVFPAINQRIGVRKDWPELATLLQKALDSINEDQRREILQRWIGVKSVDSRESRIMLSEEEQEWINSHPVVKVANEEGWPPYNFVRNGEAQGYAIDLIRLIANKTGLKLEFVNGFFWSELVQKAKVGDIDILPALWRTDERKKFLNFTRSYHKDKNVLVVRKGSSVFSLDNLDGQVLSVTRGSGFNVKVKQLYPNIRFLELDDDNQALHALRMGQSDAFMGSLGVVSYIVEDDVIPDLQIVDTIILADQPEAGQLYMATSIQNPVLASILQKGLDAISVNEKRQLQSHWIQEKSPLLSSTVADEAKFENWLWVAATLFILLLSVLFIVTQRIPDSVLVRYFGSGGFRLPALLVMTVIVILICIAINYTLQQNRRETLSQIQDNLTVTLHSVVQQMDNWVEERFNFLRQLGQNSQLVDISERLLKLSAEPDILKASSELAEARQFFAEWEKKFGRSGFFVINPQLINIGSARDSNIGIRNLIAEQQPDLLKKAFAGEAVFIPPIVSDLNKDDPQGATDCGRLCMSMFFAVPIRNTDDEVIAVLTQRLSADGGLSKILRFGRIGDSGESYAFDSNGLLASESRFREHLISAGILLRKQHEVGTIEVRDPGGNLLQGYQTPTGKIQALTHMAESLIQLGDEGLGRHHSKVHSNITSYNDYRGVPVFGAGLWDFQLGIGITTEINVNEGLAGFYRLQTSLLMIAGILLLLFVSAIVFTLILASRAGKAMGRSQDELETLVDNRTSKLQRSEEHLTIFRRFAETSNQGFGMAYLDTKIFYLNKAMCHILGESDREAVYGSSVGFYYPATIRQQLKDEILPIVLEQGQWSGEMIIKRPDGKRVPTFEYFFLISDEQGTPLFIGDVISDISEHKKAAEVLADAKEAAEAANRAKSEFLANMSHEIRTPMNAIIGFTELLDQQITEPRLSSFVKTIRSAGNNLLQLINDVLDLSKIEAGKLDIQKTPSNVHKLFTEMGNVFMLRIRNKDLDYILDIDPEIPKSLLLDATRLRQVLFNLIGNAVKFTDQGFIRVRIRTDNEDKIHSKLDLLIEVEDTGIGISQDQFEKIFGSFEQAAGQIQAKYGGTGLGLSISQRLIEMMGGKISVVSHPGKGSTFIIKLQNVVVSSMIAEELSIHEVFDSKTIQFDAGLILIVDDVPNNLSLLKENFRMTELTVIEAGNGQEAIDIAKIKSPDLILMDIRMPVMNGYQATEQIKTFLDVPIIALTASVMKDELERAKTGHFDGYLRKPVLRSDLFNELMRFLPYDRIEIDNQQEQQVILTDTALESLPEALEQLEQHSSQWNAVVSSNNLKEITQFSDNISDIAGNYSVEPLQDYANQLSEQIDSFDISGIRKMLNKFPSMQEMLKAQLTKD